MFKFSIFKSIKQLLFVFIFFFLISQSAIAENFRDTQQNSSSIPISVFIRDNCKHCHAEIEFLKILEETNENLQINLYDIKGKQNKENFIAIAELEELSKTTPITLVGNTIIQGFDSAKTTGKRIESLVKQSEGKKTMNFSEYLKSEDKGEIEIIAGKFCDAEKITACELDTSSVNYLITIPFFGVFNLQKYSLGTMSVILGFVDGFNPCAMWVLLTFLVVLVQIGNRKKMFQIAGIFILAEAFMYYLILNLWLTTWDFVGLDNFITPFVGIISLGGALFFLYEFWTSDGTCKITSLKQRHKTTLKINQLIESPLTWITFFGIIGLAFSVNIIEFACSIGIPQAFTKILNLNYLDGIERQIYLWIYTLFYMLDDFIIFGIALYSIEKIGITHKYAKYCNLIGGIAMLILGGLLIFNPTALIF